MQILRINHLKQILDDFDASQPKSDQDKLPREEDFSYVESITNYFYASQQSVQIASHVDYPIEKIRAIHVEAINRFSDDSSWLPADLLERLCAVLSDKKLDAKSVAGRAIFSNLMCSILASLTRQSIFDVSMLEEADFSFRNVGFLWVIESLFAETSAKNYQMSRDELRLILQNLNCAVALVVSLMALDSARDCTRQALKAVFTDRFNKNNNGFVGDEQMLLNMFFHHNPQYLKPLHGIPAALDMIAKSDKEISVNDLDCLFSNPQYAHIYANAIRELYGSMRHEKFNNIRADVTRKMQDRPQCAHSLGIIVKQAVCFQSGKLLVNLDEIEQLDDEQLNAFAFMMNKMSDKMRTSENVSVLLGHVKFGDMCQISYLCDMLDLLSRLFNEPDNAFARMIDNLPFAAQYLHLSGLLDDGKRLEFMNDLQLSLDIIFVNPSSANARIMSLASLKQEYDKFKQIGKNHEMVPYLIAARNRIFKNPEIAEELSRRVCLQARNWDGCFPLIPQDKIVNAITQTQKVRHSPKLFAPQAVTVEDQRDLVSALAGKQFTACADL